MTSSDQVTGRVTRMGDLEKYHTHMHTLELLPGRGGEESHSAAATAAAERAGRAAFIGLWLAVASGRSSAKTSAKTSHGFVLLIMVLLTPHGPRVPLDKSLVTDALMKLLSYESQCGATNRQK